MQSFRDGQLIVKAPNDRGRTLQVKIRLSDSAVVKVHASDFSMARPGDMIDIEGWTGDPAGAVGSLVAEKVTITAVKPFQNAKRAKLMAAAAKAAAQLAAQKQERKPRGGKSAVADSDMEADEPAAEASPPADANPAAASNPTATGKPAAKGVSLRQPGDPPAEGILLVDGFSVDEPKPGAGGVTALHVAARYGQAAVVELLLESARFRKPARNPASLRS